MIVGALRPGNALRPRGMHPLHDPYITPFIDRGIRRRGRTGQRQLDFEAAPRAGLAARRQRPTVTFNDLAADRQTESSPFRLGGEGVADLVELLEDGFDLG